MNRSRQKLQDTLGPAIDEGHHNWLDQNHPQFLAIIEGFVFDPDITPDNLANFLQSSVSQHRDAFVLACAGALRHLRRIHDAG